MDVPLSMSPGLQKLPFIPTQTHEFKHWNSLIKHHAKLKDDHSILDTYTQMESLGVLPDKATLPLVLKACGQLQAVERGKKLHKAVLSAGLISDIRVQTALVDFYSKCGMLMNACKVFDEMTDRDLVSWNAMISGCVGCSEYQKALVLFSQMQNGNLKANSVTIVELLRACGELLELRLGKEIHGYCLRHGLFNSNPHVGASLMWLYMKFDPSIAALVFEMLDSRNTVSWNTMISGYVNIGDCLKSLQLFISMLIEGFKCDLVTLLVVIQACVEYGNFELGKQVHQLVIKFGYNSMHIVNALMNMYSKFSDFGSLYELFNSIPTKDAALWNSMLSCFIEKGFIDESIDILAKMHLEEIQINERTLVIIFPLCAHLSNGLVNGKSLHAYAFKIGQEKNKHIENSLVNMYAMFNLVEDATRIFTKMKFMDVVSYNVMISGLVHNQHNVQACEVFIQMLELEIKPNSQTVTSILAGFNGVKFLNVGRSIHGYVMKCGIQIDEYLNTALTEMYINCEDEETDASIWRALIGACRNYSNTHMAESAFENLIELEPTNAGNYVLLSNIYAAKGLWSEVKNLRLIVKNKGLKKPAGRSWIVIKSKLHLFAAGDKTHTQSNKIYKKLTFLLTSIKEMGYVPDLSWVLHDEDDDRKLARLSSHSEKLAVAFGLISVKGGSPILITKNLRICGDCHEFSKYVSKLTKRTIILRDASRFHHFVHGSCSCKDFW
ncbi:hypothetical protein E3N88_16424 [Mikania micrantha]|uniref:DYW domain-containing protein n=1 Tax=Mikania micrantha TaxID=192012 RepID=A0A5N6NYC9_9ASTR|nr:hypothetical protein E3N88_16424 [Mikania micrantha]